VHQLYLEHQLWNRDLRLLIREVHITPNTASGTDSEANLGTIKMENSNVRGRSVIQNRKNISNSGNAAYGTRSEANMGTIKMENTTVNRGSVSNSGNISR